VQDKINESGKGSKRQKISQTKSQKVKPLVDEKFLMSKINEVFDKRMNTQKFDIPQPLIDQIVKKV
jgi:hypothetical protein